MRDFKHCSLAALHRLHCCTRLCLACLRVCFSVSVAGGFGHDVSPAFAENPGDYFDFKFWKLTLPLDANQDGKVDEISVRSLDYFTLNSFISMNNDTWSLPHLIRQNDLWFV